LDLSKPSDVLQVNKRTIHRATDHMGMRQALRAGTVNGHSEGGREFIDNIRELGVTAALSIRDHPSTTAIPATD
jgi:enoyl-CoA hydratase